MRDFSAALIEELPRLRRYAIALTGSVAAADDLVQDCVERALRRRETLERFDRLYPWLRTILHNIHLDEMRQRRRRGSALDVDDFANQLTLSVAPADRGESLEFIRAMNSLSFEHRQVILLVGLEELSYREVAEELGVPLGTVMSRLSRARAQLRIILSDGGAAPAVASPRQAARGVAE